MKPGRTSFAAPGCAKAALATVHSHLVPEPVACRPRQSQYLIGPLADQVDPLSERSERVGPLRLGPGPGTAGSAILPSLMLFGAMGGCADPRKGADLSLEALQRLYSQVAGMPLEQLELVVFGQSRSAQPPDLGFPIH